MVNSKKIVAIEKQKEGSTINFIKEA